MSNSRISSALNTAALCFANKAARTAGVNLAFGLQFPLIS